MRSSAIKICVWVLCAWCVGAHGATATATRGEPATIDAKTLRFDRPNNMAYAEGDVVVRYKDAVLRADKVRLNTETKDVWAEGNVRLNRQGQEWVSPAVQYNFESRALSTEKAGGSFPPLLFTGEHLQTSGTNHYSVGSASVTTCDYEQPHYRLEATHAEIWPGERMVLKNVVLKFGDVPVFWFPVVAWSLKDDAPPVGVAFGNDSRMGFFVLTSTSWALNEHIKLTLDVDGRTRRGIGGGPELHYRFDGGGRGVLSGYYTGDEHPQDSYDKLNGVKIPEDRYKIGWLHKQSFTNNVDLTIALHKQSDPDVIDDFFHRDFRLDAEPASVADVTKRGQNYMLSLMVQPQLNDFFAEVERLPEAKFRVNRSQLWHSPLYYEGVSSAGYYNNERGDTGDPLFTGSTARFDTFHQIVSPQMVGGWLSVVPHAGVRYTYYQRAPFGAPVTSEVQRVVGDLGMDVSMKLSRTWPDVKNKALGIDGLRHILEPFANYQWVPGPDVAPQDLFQFDTVRSMTLTNGDMFPVTRYMPLGFPEFNATDAIGRENVVRFGVRQRLQTRRDGKPWDLVELATWTDYHAERVHEERDFADLFNTLELRPNEWIALEASSRFDMRMARFSEVNTGVHVTYHDLWSVGVGSRYLREDSALMALTFSCRLWRGWSFRTYQRIDFKDNTWEEQEYMLRQELHDWFIEYGVRHRAQRVGPDELAVFFAVTLKAFPGSRIGMNRMDI